MNLFLCFLILFRYIYSVPFLIRGVTGRDRTARVCDKTVSRARKNGALWKKRKAFDLWETTFRYFYKEYVKGDVIAESVQSKNKATSFSSLKIDASPKCKFAGHHVRKSQPGRDGLAVANVGCQPICRLPRSRRVHGDMLARWGWGLGWNSPSTQCS